MRLSFIEAVWLVVIGVAMVELHDGQRHGRPGMQFAAAPAMAAKSAALVGPVRPNDALIAPNESDR